MTYHSWITCTYVVFLFFWHIKNINTYFGKRKILIVDSFSRVGSSDSSSSHISTIFNCQLVCQLVRLCFLLALGYSLVPLLSGVSLGTIEDIGKISDNLDVWFLYHLQHSWMFHLYLVYIVGCSSCACYITSSKVGCTCTIFHRYITSNALGCLVSLYASLSHLQLYCWMFGFSLCHSISPPTILLDVWILFTSHDLTSNCNVGCLLMLTTMFLS